MHDFLELELDGLAHDGRGIGRLKNPRRPGERGLTVFVAGGLPGQTVHARIIARKPRFVEAQAEGILRQAADAGEPLCPHAQGDALASGCGGCPLQTMPYERQLEWKSRLACDALTRIGGLDAALLREIWTTPLPSPALAGFRNRMTLTFGTVAGQLALGQRRRGGPDVIPTPGCRLLPEGAHPLMAQAQSQAAQSGLPAWTAPERRGSRGGNSGGFWRSLTLRQGWLAGEVAPRWWILCLTSPGGAEERAAVRALGESLFSLGGPSRLGGFIHEERARPDALALGERRILCLDETGAERPEAAILRLPLGGRCFALDAASFFQVNTAAAELLAATLAEMTPASAGSGLLDVCCGVGAPGQLLARQFPALLGLEADKRAIAAARRNAQEVGLKDYRYEAGDASRLLRSLAGGCGRPRRPAAGPEQWDMALIDPPRGGLEPDALDALLRLAPPYLLYVSCNPATLGRDAARLAARYDLESLAAVDMFPHTPHLECCSLWRRRNA